MIYLTLLNIEDINDLIYIMIMRGEEWRGEETKGEPFIQQII